MRRGSSWAFAAGLRLVALLLSAARGGQGLRSVALAAPGPKTLRAGVASAAICRYDRAACKARAESLGLKTSRADGSHFDFAGNYVTKGCYAYRSGEWKGEAYYGTIGGEDLTDARQLNDEFLPGGYRLDTCDQAARVPLLAPGDAGLALSASVVADTVMGGRSAARVSRTAEGLLFEGVVTREGGGGFASVRLSPRDSGELVRRLSSGTGVAFAVRRLRGCAAWKFQLNGDGSWLGAMFGRGWVQWQADFAARARDGAPQEVSFADLLPTRYGEPLGPRGLTASGLRSISNFGFMLSFLTAEGEENPAFQEGPFALSIALVEVY